jgi:glycosyltransferase involved in cell wall biosynthesis
MSPPEQHWFVVPDLAGPSTGGTLYNANLVRALQQNGTRADAIARSACAGLVRAGTPGIYWFDSLFLEDAVALPRELGAGQQRGLLLHYLPSLLGHGDALTRTALTLPECAALERADVVLVPSSTLAETVRRLGFVRTPIICIEPGRPPLARAPGERMDGVHALLLANVTPNKGVIELLRALAPGLEQRDDFTLSVAGSVERDAAYASACRELVRTQPSLAPRVQFLGELAPGRVAELWSRTNLLVSASIYEAYGMALAEARAAGIPILALPGGHAKVHVTAQAGGELCAGHRELARACVRLCRDPDEHRRRGQLASLHAYSPRSWLDAARELSAQLAALPP